MNAPADQLAGSVRRRRTQRGLSLGELARRCGVSKANLSRLERGGANPSLETLWRIARAMDLTIGELLADDHPSEAYTIGPEDGARVTSASGFEGRLLSTDASAHRTEVFEVALQAGARFLAEPHVPGTRELLYCLGGVATCGPVDVPLEIVAGEAASFEGDQPHVYGSTHGGRALLIMSYPHAARD